MKYYKTKMLLIITMILLITSTFCVYSYRLFTLPATNDNLIKYYKTFAPLVHLEDPITQRVGTGVIVFSQDGYTYVLTAYHVVKNSIALVATIQQEEYSVKIIEYDEILDVALLKIDSYKDFKNLARLLPKRYEVSVYDTTYTVGYVLGGNAVGTIGNISSLSRIHRSGEKRLTVTSQAFLGNSGGPTYIEKDKKIYILGLVIAIDGYKCQGISYMVYICGYKSIHDWLEKTNLHFIIYKNKTVQECLEIRRNEEKRDHKAK